MATLPDAGDLGSRVIAQRRVPVSASRGPEIEANAITQAAETLGRRAREFNAHDDQFNYARAKSLLLTKDAAIRKELETDPDWQTHESRYSEAMKGAREEAAKEIRGERSRALFDQDAQNDIERGTEQIRG